MQPDPIGPGSDTTCNSPIISCREFCGITLILLNSRRAYDLVGQLCCAIGSILKQTGFSNDRLHGTKSMQAKVNDRRYDCTSYRSHFCLLQGLLPRDPVMALAVSIDNESNQV